MESRWHRDTAETSTTFLRQLRKNHPESLVVIWDNAPAHRGKAIREYLTTPDLNLQLVSLPAYSPDPDGDRGDLGLGAGGGHSEYLFGDQGKDPRESRGVIPWAG